MGEQPIAENENQPEPFKKTAFLDSSSFSRSPVSYFFNLHQVPEELLSWFLIPNYISLTRQKLAFFDSLWSTISPGR